jgi:ArsR family transcriptional regulator
MSAPAAIARTASLFQALSDPTRVHIVQLLRHGERCVCELMTSLDAAQSRLSFHLKVLKDAGLVSDRKQGRWVYYSLREEALESMRDVLGGLEPHQERRGCCA